MTEARALPVHAPMSQFPLVEGELQVGGLPRVHGSAVHSGEGAGY